MRKIVSGDEVIVLSGDDKGKTGKVLKVIKTNNRLFAIVSGIRIYKKATKPTAKASGGILKKEGKIDLSSLALLDPINKIATRVGFKFTEDNRKVRFAKVSKEIIN